MVTSIYKLVPLFFFNHVIHVIHVKDASKGSEDLRRWRSEVHLQIFAVLSNALGQDLVKGDPKKASSTVDGYLIKKYATHIKIYVAK